MKRILTFMQLLAALSVVGLCDYLHMTTDEYYRHRLNNKKCTTIPIINEIPNKYNLPSYYL